MPEFVMSLPGLENSLSDRFTAGFSDEEVHIVLDCRTRAEQIRNNQDPRQTDCLPPYLRQKVLANTQHYSDRQFNSDIFAWYISHRQTAMIRNADGIRALGFDPATLQALVPPAAK